MARLIINGGKKLKGEWPLSGNKNEALALTAASLLFKDGLKLTNVPEIKDVKVMMQIAEYLGVEIKNPAKGTYFLKGLSKTNDSQLPAELSSKIRGSLLFLGPLLAIGGKAVIPRSGGDKIGLRKIDVHLDVFRAFGAKTNQNEILLDRNRYLNVKEVKLWLSEPSVTATENAIMLAALRNGKTIVKNAACEPHVVNLGLALEQGGVKIKGLGTNLIEIRGRRNLKSTACKLKEDYMELASVLTLSAIFEGGVKVKTKNIKEYAKIFEVFKKFGKKVVKENGALKVMDNDSGDSADLQKEIQEISDGPWPNFPSDSMSPMIVLATQCKGDYLFHEKMFESRLYFIDQLKVMGAKVVLCDPHRVLVSGPSQLHGSHMTSPDIRAGMALVIAALCAKGTSIIDNAEQIDRGYENLVEKLKKIGADIKHE